MSQFTVIVSQGRGSAGAGSYVYVAWASDASGTDFTTTYNADLDYIAFLTSPTPISPLQASHFTGLWKCYTGQAGGAMNWLGLYSAGTTYHLGDGVISSQGRGFVALGTTVGNAPPTYPDTTNDYWSLFAEKGADGAGVGDLKADGTVPLSADWDVGSHEIRAETLESDVATGTPPLTVASTTKVNNLNVAALNGKADTAFLEHSLATAANDMLAASGSGSFVKKTRAEILTLLGIDKMTINFGIDGGASAITTGVKPPGITIPVACTITSVEAVSEDGTSGSIVVDIWKDSYANSPPTDGDSITASAPVTISSSTKSQDSTLIGWTKSLSAGDRLVFNVDSCTSIKKLSICLKVDRA